MNEEQIRYETLPSVSGTFLVETEDGVTHVLSNVNGLAYTREGDTRPIKHMDFASWRVGGIGVLHLSSGYLDSPAEVRTSTILSITQSS